MEKLSIPPPVIFNNDVVAAQLESAALEGYMNPVEISRILVLYSGGTIGMKNTPQHGYLPIAGYLTGKLMGNSRFHEVQNQEEAGLENIVHRSVKESDLKINSIPVKKLSLPALMTPYSLYNKRIRYSILEYDPLLDSSNMTMDEWIRIATDIEVNYELFDAFVVLHGTDTMAYTASALSFLLENLGKTVIITGSQVPLSEIRTDAVDNLLGALTIAGHFTIPEVGLFFDNKLLRGNRASKVNAVEFNAFDSPNLSPIVNVGINIDVAWDKVWRPKRIARFKAHKILNPNVATLRLFPGITKETVNAFFSPSIAGVILETYGSGNAPSNRPDILEIIKNACERGVVVVNCSQCKKATVSAIYETGVALFNIGVVPGADMTPECALTKLTYLLGKWNDPERVRSLMGQNLRGELSIINRKQRFAYLPKVSQFAYSKNVLVSSILSLLGSANISNSPIQSPIQQLSEMAIDDSSMALEESTIDANELHASLEARLVPLAMCHAARLGDLSTLKYLINDFGPLINVANDDGQTVLHAAVREGRIDCVSFLLRSGSNVHIRDRYGRSVLMDAVRGNHMEIVHILQVAGAHFSSSEVNDVANQLCKAVKEQNLDRVKLFIEAGANPNLGYIDDRTALHIAAADGSFEIVEYLVGLKTVPVTMSPTIPKKAPLKMPKIVSKPVKKEITSSPYIEAGTNRKSKSFTAKAPNKKSSGDSSSPDTASSDDEPKQITRHIQIDIQPLDRWKKTPLMDAELFGHEKIIQLLKSKLMN